MKLLNRLERKSNTMTNEIDDEIKYLLNSHHELILNIKKSIIAVEHSNAGLLEMNILIRELISEIKEKK